MRKPTRLFTIEHAISTYYHEVPVGVTLEDIQKPEYWAHVAPQFRPKYRIVCDAEDGTWTATLVVRSVGKVELFVSVEHSADFSMPKKATAKKSPYFIKWNGPKEKFCVMMGEGQQVTIVEKDFGMEEQAQEWIDKHTAAAKSAA